MLFGDIQSRRHVLAFRAHVETYHALRRQDATAQAVLHAAKQSVAGEELSYFDDALFSRLDRSLHARGSTITAILKTIFSFKETIYYMSLTYKSPVGYRSILLCAI